MLFVFVVSRDWTLRTALRAELRERGADALGLETADDIGKALAQGIVPSVVVIDSAELEHELSREQIANLAKQLAILVIDSRVAPAPQIPGTERLERPITIGEIAARVQAHLAAGGN
jgi:DNA-binding response OmpR family regulator